MKKEFVIILTVVVVSIIFGITALQDEVLTPSPSLDTSQNPHVEEKKITIPSDSISSIEQTEQRGETPVELIEPAKIADDETKIDVMEVRISDGIGSGDK